jgi:hypothetical protein
MTPSQWERLLQNAGTWVGSFTQLSPQGETQGDIPSVVALKPLERGNLMRQEIRKWPADGPPTETVLDYRSLNKSILFFEGGAFSQGSIQWGPFAEFGAELGLMADPHRLRLVQLFDKTGALHRLTLIREHREDQPPSDRPHLTVEQLLGTWRGEAVTLYPDLRPSDQTATELHLRRDGDTLHQTLTYAAGAPPIQSQGRILGDRGDRIKFDSGPQTVQVLLLPDGGSSTSPVTLQPRQPLFLELGWLITPNRRQRLIRRYNAQGGWASLTLVTETRVSGAEP